MAARTALTGERAGANQKAAANQQGPRRCYGDGRVAAHEHAEQAGADEGLMLDPHGFVNTTNVFIVRRGEVWTSTGDYCMNGVTR